MSRKKYLAILSFLIATSTVLFGCSSDDEEGLKEIKAVPMEENVDSFFKEKIAHAYSKVSYQADDGFILKENSCNRIDSKEELMALYRGDDVLPEIDFSKYTLVLGARIYYGDGIDKYHIKQAIFESPGGYILNLYCHRFEDWAELDIIPSQILYYGLYPKLLHREITVNLVYE